MSEKHPPGEEEPYSSQDRERWKEGGERFRAFYASLSHDERRSIYVLPGNIWSNAGEFQALFLGEKAVFLAEASWPRSIAEKAKAFGFSVTGDFIYDAARAEELILQHQKIFEDIPHNTAEECLQSLRSTAGESPEIAPAKQIALGVLLGFPVSASEFYAKGTNDLSEGFGTHGMNWVDHKESVESKNRELQLKTAFEIAGVLDVGDELIEETRSAGDRW